MEGRNHIEAIVFDVDGTLIDSNGAHADTWAQALREQGIQRDLTDVRRVIFVWSCGPVVRGIVLSCFVAS
jgi:phosphoglycolate phosphatase-like HAD superfamily hydrolase